MSMSEHTEIKTYSEKDTEEIITNRHTGTWKIGTYNHLRGEFFQHIELRYFNGLKPHWFHRLMARLLLGWKWEDKK